MKDVRRLTWKTVAREKIFAGPIFDVRKVRRESTDGRLGDFIELNAPKWATIIPWVRNEEGVPCFIMVRQFRHGSNTVTIEFPAGTVDEGEEPKEAALRELREETGYLAKSEIIELGSISPNPAFMNNRVWFFLAEGLEYGGPQLLDPNEQLDILTIPVKEVVDSMGTGDYDNGIMMIAQAYFLRFAQKRPDLLL